MRDIEELMLERGVVVTYETIRCWCDKFGARFAQCAKAARRKPGSTWHLDELFVTLRGEPYLLWRAVDEHGADLDVLVQKRRRPRQSASSSACCVQTRRGAGSLPTSFAAIRRRRLRFPSSLM
ncbi:transposase-like protein [Paraburkholderia sp. RAU6.4a]